MKKAIIFASVTILLVGLLAGCATDWVALYNDDARIAASRDRFSARVAVQKNTMGEYSYRANKFSGIMVLQNNFTVGEDGVVECEFSFEGGRTKLVLVKGGNVYLLTDTPTDGEGFAKITTDAPSGSGYTLKLVSEGAKLSVRVKK